MIPLKLDAEFDETDAGPFVVRLGDEDNEAEAALVGELDGRLFYQHAGTTFSVNYPDSASMAGDVVFANPAGRAVHRWIRRGARHNTLLVTERCDQLCQMCSQPPRKTHVDMFPYLEQACLLAEPNVEIGISGGEPLLYKNQLFDMLETVARLRPDLRFHILSNAQHFTEDDASRLRQEVYERVLWGIPLYSDDPAVHDEIVVKEGAFDRLLESFAILARSAQAIELRTVLLRRNYQDLPRLAYMLSDRLPFVSHWAVMQLERIGFARNRWRSLFVDHSANPQPLERAIAIATARGLEVVLFNTPYCTVPERLRQYLHASISDWKRAWSAECHACKAKALCGGFFAWHPSLDDYAGGGAIL
jgi:His-Xaa-Ser system radical SAM maturase HxsC